MPFPYLQAERYKGTKVPQTHSAEEMRRLAGCPPEHLKRMPPELVTAMRKVDGVRVCILTADGARRFWNNPHTNTPMRVIAECPTCGKLVAASRINQHARVHNGSTRSGY